MPPETRQPPTSPPRAAPPGRPTPPPESVEQWRLRLVTALELPAEARLEQIELAISVLRHMLAGMPELRVQLGLPASASPKDVAAAYHRGTEQARAYERMLGGGTTVAEDLKWLLEQISREVKIPADLPPLQIVVKWVEHVLTERAVMLRALRELGIEVGALGPHLTVTMLAARAARANRGGTP